MRTGNFESWAGTISDIGPIYPFVGFELFFYVICVIFWLVFHVVQIKGEMNEHEDMDHVSKEKIEDAKKLY